LKVERSLKKRKELPLDKNEKVMYIGLKKFGVRFKEEDINVFWQM